MENAGEDEALQDREEGKEDGEEKSVLGHALSLSLAEEEEEAEEGKSRLKGRC